MAYIIGLTSNEPGLVAWLHIIPWWPACATYLVPKRKELWCGSPRPTVVLGIQVHGVACWLNNPFLPLCSPSLTLFGVNTARVAISS